MLATTLCGIKLKNPTILASGILGVTKQTINRIGNLGAGAVTLKSLCHEERFGNKNPTVIVLEHGMLNAVGLPGQGIDSALKDFRTLKNIGVPAIGSIFGYTVEQFGAVAKKMSKLEPSMIEVNISCPHMGYSKPFYSDAGLISDVTKAVKKNTHLPVSIKLSPNVYNIGELAMACEKAGADAVTAVNTASGMAIDIDARKPILSNRTGGISGPSLKPIALKCVYDIYKSVSIPIIGTGGITNGKDLIEMSMAGATCFGIGTAAYYRGLNVFKDICSEATEWLKQNKISSLEKIKGIAHE